MTEKEKLKTIYDSLCQIEIKGANNVVRMASLMSFIQAQINEIEKNEKKQSVDFIGGS